MRPVSRQLIGFLRGRALLQGFLPGQFDKDLAQDLGVPEHIVLGHGADLVGMRLDIIGDDRLDFFARHIFGGHRPERKHQSGGQQWRKSSGFQSSSPWLQIRSCSQNVRGATAGPPGCSGLGRNPPGGNRGGGRPGKPGKRGRGLIQPGGGP